MSISFGMGEDWGTFLSGGLGGIIKRIIREVKRRLFRPPFIRVIRKIPVKRLSIAERGDKPIDISNLTWTLPKIKKTFADKKSEKKLINWLLKEFEKNNP